MATVETKITKAHRKYISELVCHSMYELSEVILRNIFDCDSKDAYDQFITDLARDIFAKSEMQFVNMRLDVSLLTDGKMNEEIRRILGQILVVAKTVSPALAKLPNFEERMQLVHELQQVLKGKAKAEGSTRKRMRQEEEVAAIESSSTIVNYNAPMLHILRPSSVDFVPAPRLGEGTFAFVCKVIVKDIAFPDEVYAGKCMKMADGNMSPEMMAMHEATSVPLQHRGIIAPKGLVRRERIPVVVYRFWNGGHLDQWIAVLRGNATKPVAKDFQETIGTPDLVKANIFKIINGLMQTVEFMHYHEFMHNDLHGRNILLHFGARGVYVGIADWGRAAIFPTTAHFPALTDLNPSTRASWQNRYKFVAPECISTNPPPYSKSQEVYSLCYHIRRLLDCLPPRPNSSLERFVQRMYTTVKKGLALEVAQRPTAFDISLCISGSQNVGLNIVKSDGLRPEDD